VPRRRRAPAALLVGISDPTAEATAAAEREFLAAEGDCNTPLARTRASTAA
jgi:hypothetical protein